MSAALAAPMSSVASVLFTSRRDSRRRPGRLADAAGAAEALAPRQISAYTRPTTAK
jgi:hypothetical protein